MPSSENIRNREFSGWLSSENTDSTALCVTIWVSEKLFRALLLSSTNLGNTWVPTASVESTWLSVQTLWPINGWKRLRNSSNMQMWMLSSMTQQLARKWSAWPMLASWILWLHPTKELGTISMFWANSTISILFLMRDIGSKTPSPRQPKAPKPFMPREN